MGTLIWDHRCCSNLLKLWWYTPRRKSHVCSFPFRSCLGHQTKIENSRVTFKLRATQSHQRRPGALSQSLPGKNARTMSNQKRFAFFRLLCVKWCHEQRATKSISLRPKHSEERKIDSRCLFFWTKALHPLLSSLPLCRPTCDSITWLRAAHSRAPLLFTVIWRHDH